MAEQEWLNPATAPSPSPYQNVIAAPSLAAPAYELRPLSLGELLDRTFALYRSRFWLFAGIASVAAVVELIAAATGRILLHHYSHNAATIATGGLAVGYAADFIYFFIYCVTQAATCFAMSEVYLGRPASIAASLRAVRGKWYAWIGIALWQAWSLVWLAMVLSVPVFVLVVLRIVQQNTAIAILLFFLVFAIIGAIAFGFIAYIRNSLAIPAKVVEGMTVRKAMRRSKDLTSGAKGRVFVLLLILWALSLVTAMVSVPLALVMAAAPAANHVVAEISLLLVGFFSRVLVPPVLSIGLCLIYFDQRVRTEAFDLEVLLGPEQSASLPSSQLFSSQLSSLQSPSSPSHSSPSLSSQADVGAQANAPLL